MQFAGPTRASWQRWPFSPLAVLSPPGRDSIEDIGLKQWQQWQQWLMFLVDPDSTNALRLCLRRLQMSCKRLLGPPLTKTPACLANLNIFAVTTSC